LNTAVAKLPYWIEWYGIQSINDKGSVTLTTLLEDEK